MSNRSASIDRREFLRRGIAGVSVAATFPVFLGKTAAAAAAAPDAVDAAGEGPVLVVLQLSGGNDGLSTVVPYSDPEYARVRPTLRIGEKEALRIDERMGLHPNLKDLKEVFDEGLVAIVQGVSYPNPTRSHFEAMDIWQAGGRPFVREGTGWIGRAVDSCCGNRPDPTFGVSLGGSVPLAMRGKSWKPVAFADPNRYRWTGSAGEEAAFAKLNEPRSSSGASGELDYLRRVAADARGSSETIRRAAQGYRPKTEYPAGNRLAAELRTVAALIAARLGRIHYVSFGGFDTHANQKGTHDNLMRNLSTAVAAFVRDLRESGMLHRVLLMTFSEFGRRVKENGSRGTDHGVAAPMFLVGSGARGGLHGPSPDLAQLVGGDLALGVDFRRVYASVLDGWLKIPSSKVLGESFEALPVLKEAGAPRAL